MDTPNIIAVAIVAVAFALVIGIRIYTLRKSGTKVTLDTFINMYGDQVVAVLKDVVQILQINREDFEDQKNYEASIVSTTIDKIKENAAELGFDKRFINVVDTASLTDLIFEILYNNEVEVFSAIGGEEIAKNPKLYSAQVITALTEVLEIAVSDAKADDAPAEEAVEGEEE